MQHLLHYKTIFYFLQQVLHINIQQNDFPVNFKISWTSPANLPLKGIIQVMFKKAVVRKPSINFNEGITDADLGAPELSIALAQHSAYCQVLQQCGLALTELPPDPRFPDSTFVEDTAALTGHCAILTHPGAPSREGEVDAIRPAIEQHYERIFRIEPPGMLDGGDICDADGHFFIGISRRTNEEIGRAHV